MSFSVESTAHKDNTNMGTVGSAGSSAQENQFQVAPVLQV